MTEVQDRYRLVSSGFDAVVGDVGDVGSGGWDAQTPCEGWSARDVVAHIVTGHRRIIANVKGGEPAPLGADEDPRTAWEHASRAVDDITGDPGGDQHGDRRPDRGNARRRNHRTVRLHGRARPHLGPGQDGGRRRAPRRGIGPPGLRRSEADGCHDPAARRVFGAKLDPPAGADLQTEFLCFLGRRA